MAIRRLNVKKEHKIETWKDIINKNQKTQTHKWVFVRSYSRLGGRSLTGMSSPDERYQIYSCKRCGITAKKYPGDDQLILEDPSYESLTCDEAIVMDILT